MAEVHQIEGTIETLTGNLSGYAILRIPQKIVGLLPSKQRTRLLAIIDDHVEIPVGMAALGDGDYYFMLAKRNQKKLGKGPGDPVSFTIQKHPHPLGVELPEVLQVLLDQDEEALKIWNGLTDGHKRSIIFGTMRIKDIDRQIEKITTWLNDSLNK